jgi:hypothetical protein
MEECTKTMKMKKTTATRLASLSALGAGALVSSTGQLQAGIIETDLSPVQQVGFSAGFNPSYTVVLPGTARFNVRTSSSSAVSAARTAGYVKFAGLFGAGKSFGGVGGSSLDQLAHSSTSTFPRQLYTNKFLIFKFQDSTSSNAIRYGWLELSAALNGVGMPDVTLTAFAYDDSGAQIVTPLGNGSSTVPEPASIALSGLGALVLGASGVRRWRTAKKDGLKTA